MSRDEELELIRIGFLPDINKTEFVLRYKTMGKIICDRYPNIKLLILTLDEDGAVVYESKTQTCIYSRAKAAIIRSTVGAGDSFSAAFLYEYIQGESLEKCLDKAIQLSSYVVSQNEAVPKYSNVIFN